MSFEDEMTDSGPFYILAISEADPLLTWVRENCPAFMSEPEFFRFMFQVAKNAMDQAKAQLQTDTAGVLQAVEPH